MMFYPSGVNYIVRVYIAQLRKISIGDKMAGSHGNKGVISTILLKKICRFFLMELLLILY